MVNQTETKVEEIEGMITAVSTDGGVVTLTRVDEKTVAQTA